VQSCWHLQPTLEGRVQRIVFTLFTGLIVIVSIAIYASDLSDIASWLYVVIVHGPVVHATKL